jgi:regulator of protease activity HflC (stomatin/prohibitin superfamily)
VAQQDFRLRADPGAHLDEASTSPKRQSIVNGRLEKACLTMQSLTLRLAVAVKVTGFAHRESLTQSCADNLKIAFRVHTVWRVDESRVPLFMERFSTTVSERALEQEPDAIVKVAYDHFIREPLRTFARDEVQQRNGLEVKDALIPIGDAVLARIRGYAADSPFVISSVVVGNIQYPAEVSDAVSPKLAATQDLQRMDTEIEIEREERTKREVQAQGIANAMEIIRGQLSGMYIQHEAIEAQKAMVNSPNHTVVYIPVGPMGVPLTGTFPTVPVAEAAAAR